VAVEVEGQHLVALVHTGLGRLGPESPTRLHNRSISLNVTGVKDATAWAKTAMPRS
jgi:hypothetical protein